MRGWKPSAPCGAYNQRAHWKQSPEGDGCWRVLASPLSQVTCCLLALGIMCAQRKVAAQGSQWGVWPWVSTCTTLWFSWRRQRICVLPSGRSRGCALPIAWLLSWCMRQRDHTDTGGPYPPVLWSMVKSPCSNWKGCLALSGSLTSAGDHINLSPVVKPQSVPVGEEIVQAG